jgi:hypothetical protein
MVFDPKSRYVGLSTYLVKDHRGRTVPVVPVPAAPKEGELGIHVLKQGERLDHLAQRYLNDPAGYWRICERNDVMSPEALSEGHQTTAGLQRMVKGKPFIDMADDAKPDEISIPGGKQG